LQVSDGFGSEERCLNLLGAGTWQVAAKAMKAMKAMKATQAARDDLNGRTTTL